MKLGPDLSLASFSKSILQYGKHIHDSNFSYITCVLLRMTCSNGLLFEGNDAKVSQH